MKSGVVYLWNEILEKKKLCLANEEVPHLSTILKVTSLSWAELRCGFSLLCFSVMSIRCRCRRCRCRPKNLTIVFACNAFITVMCGFLWLSGIIFYSCFFVYIFFTVFYNLYRRFLDGNVLKEHYGKNFICC